MLAADPSLPGIHQALGELYADSSRDEKAAEHYEKELERSSGGPPLHYRYGRVLLRLGRSAAALEQLLRAVEGAPGRAETHFYLGKAQLDQGQFSAAKASFLAALAAGPAVQTAMSVHYQLSQISRSQGRDEEAAGHLREFRRLRGQVIREDQQGKR